MSRRRLAVLTVVAVALAGATAVVQHGAARRTPAGPGPAAAASPEPTPEPGDPSRSPEGASRTVPRRPNVVVIMADDMRADDLRFMPRTRRLLGGKGVRFRNAFSPYPLCCPARSSFLTGRYTHNHHVWSHLDPWGFQALDDSSTLPLWLQEAGYRTIFLGKYLNYYGVQPLPDGRSSATYVPPGWTDWRAAVDGGIGADHPLEGSTYDYFDTTLNVNGSLEGHEGEYQTTMLGDQSVEIIERYAEGRRPFFFWASYVAPHHGQPFEADDPGVVVRDDGRLTEFVTPARPEHVKGRFDRRVRRAPGSAGEADVSDKPFFIRQLPEVNEAEAEAMLEVTRQRAEALAVLDVQVSRTVRALRRTGELDDTIVVFTSDNGYYLGEHRRRQGKSVPYEPALNVPLLLRGPGVPAGEVRTDPFLTIDVAPTVLAAAHASLDRGLDGVSLWEVARLGDRGWTRPVLTDSGPRAGHRRYSVGVRTRDHYYVEHHNGKRELYDMRRDPAQLTNLAPRRGSRADLRRLAAVLADLRGCRERACSRPLSP